MPNRESFSHLTFFQCVPPQIVDATTNGATVDTLGYDTVTFELTTGALSSITSASYWVGRIQHASHSTAGIDAWADCASADVIRDASAAMTSGIWVSLFSDTNFESTTFKVGYIGNKRYTRCIIEEKGNLSTAAMAVTAILGNAAHWPVSTPNVG